MLPLVGYPVAVHHEQLGLPFGHHAVPPAFLSHSEPTEPDATVEFYFVRRQRARRYLLRLDSDGRARVTIPRGGSLREATAFGLRHLSWIAGQRVRIWRSGLSAEEQRGLQARAGTELPSRLLVLAAVHGLVVPRVGVRNQRTRWGSCGRDGHISLNWRLILMPEWVRDYVMIHELMHLRRLDHSSQFWRLVSKACPDYEQARRWLRLHGPSLRWTAPCPSSGVTLSGVTPSGVTLSGVPVSGVTL